MWRNIFRNSKNFLALFKPHQTQRMKKTILFIVAFIIALTLSAQEGNNSSILVSGGPLIRYQVLHGLSGIYLGGAGSIQLNDAINITAQGVLLANGKSFRPSEELQDFQTEDLQSGYGGLGLQVKALTAGDFRFYGEADLIAGGYSYQPKNDVFFWSFEFGLKAKYPLNQFISLAGGLTLPLYSAQKADIELYRTTPVISFAVEFGHNNYNK